MTLSSLTIGSLSFSPKFSPSVNSYTTTVTVPSAGQTLAIKYLGYEGATVTCALENVADTTAMRLQAYTDPKTQKGVYELNLSGVANTGTLVVTSRLNNQTAVYRVAITVKVSTK